MTVQEEKQRFKNWLYEAYDTNYLSGYFFNELESVYIGNYKNLRVSIPVTDLQEMWMEEKPVLDKIYDRNKRAGREMSASARVLYDLAIVVSKYGEFLQRKERNRRIQAERENNKNKSKINYNKLPRIWPSCQRTDLNKVIEGGE